LNSRECNSSFKLVFVEVLLLKWPFFFFKLLVSIEQKLENILVNGISLYSQHNIHTLTHSHTLSTKIKNVSWVPFNWWKFVFSSSDPFCLSVLHSYVDNMNFQGMEIDSALR
jgi:hypothetical protein